MSRIKRNPRRAGRPAFTLVELLVVIGIIAVLISILLPALNRARRQAKAVQCSSNMRQVAMAMLQYINSAKGKFPPAEVQTGGDIYPNGWFWCNELVLQGYIKGPNLYNFDGSKNDVSRSPFYCPEGIPEEANLGIAASVPTDGANNTYYPGKTYPATATTPKISYPTWYMLNSRNLSGTNKLNGGDQQTPFVYYNNNMDAALRDEPAGGGRWTRHMGLVKKASELIMIVEANNNNFYDQADPVPGHIMRRLAARHGQKHDSGREAYTNFAFFDGHVAMYDSQLFDQNKLAPSGKGGFYHIKRETIGTLNEQH
jgi:prepilin-type N-terminal cleavage/methylation domain-containing protein/prepilin-type processing-associated H-X9-DG protein